MHQMRKGNQRHLGMKAHVGFYADTELVLSVAMTAVNIVDSSVLTALLHRNETAMWGEPAKARRRYCLRTHPRPKT